MEDHKPKLYARLRVKTGEYESDGKTKNRYAEIGVLFASPHFNNMYMNIDTLPISKDWDGRIYVNPIEENKVIQTADDFKESRPIAQHEVLEQAKKNEDVIIEDIDDKPIDLSEIPF